MTEYALAADGIVASRGKRWLLAGLDLQLSFGEIAIIRGPSGIGKSTLLHVLAGLLRADQGQVTLMGTRLEQWQPLARAQRLSLAVQTPTLPPELTLRELVRLGRLPHLRELASAAHRPKRRNDPDPAAVERALAAVGLRDLAARTLGSLSGGEQRRAHLARVLAQQAKVMLLDEPTTHLDAFSVSLVRSELQRRADAGAAVLLVTHDDAWTRQHLGRELRLCDGRLFSAPQRQPAARRSLP